MVLGAALPGLVFLMLQRTWAQYGPPPQPFIWAVPGAVVPKGSDVTIFCSIPPSVTIVRLVHLVPRTVWYDGSPQGAQEVLEFSLKNITHRNAGVYYCDYFRGGEWSRSNDILELVVTGIYNEKPFLTADSGPQGISERKVTLLCHTHPSFDIFILCRGGNASFPQSCSRQNQSTFLISPVSPGHKSTYRCFGSQKYSSYLWSLPSDLLEFSIPRPPPQPSIWVVPGAVVSTGSDVTIFCRTLPGVTTVRLARLAPSTVWYDGTPQGAQEVFEFSLKNITQSNAGVYFCAYFNGSQWSRNSKNLDLVITESSTSDCRLENHIQLILAIVILLGLGVLLLDACNNRESP
ncbi:leukocyte immunoglobulin-like receptor subfamily A member 3 [Microtus ochrogaster]|uniref:Leukocyte immunoglobulin-like receptor subfamily A member 3 n=1 Tax=Microtus ochrogaster TaxID=79684 RepID=A0ABM1TT64_MICOH|nr:leukocyte immunoglobulin-like receptor subfamily A member 3 [Microtus ochrogaster]